MGNNCYICNTNVKYMAIADIEKLKTYSEKVESYTTLSGMKYDTGKSSMVYSRGNILLGKGSFLESLHVGYLRRFFVDLFC